MALKRWVARLASASSWGRMGAAGIVVTLQLDVQPGRLVDLELSPGDARRLARGLASAADSVEKEHRPQWEKYVARGQAKPVEYFPDVED